MDKIEFMKQLKLMCDSGEIKATWEGIITDIQNIEISEDGIIVLDVNQY